MTLYEDARLVYFYYFKPITIQLTNYIMRKAILFILLIITFSCANDDAMSPAEDLDVVAEFKVNLSELNLFTGNLSDLNISSKAFEYKLNTALFTDYAHKQRVIALPNNTTLEYDGNGLPIFPENTVIAKTFYYNLDERDLSLGRQIIETRILIKINGTWETGDYKWNEDQTEAILDLNGSEVPVTWINENGDTYNITYAIPSNQDCFTCHNINDTSTPIGPKLRNLNFSINGANQLQDFINNQYVTGISSNNEVSSMVNWEDTNASLEDRARSYFDINCAHCHIPGGFCDQESTLDLAYETSLEDSNIYQRRFSISTRISEYISGFSMPYIGTTIKHREGADLLEAYLQTLE